LSLKHRGHGGRADLLVALHSALQAPALAQEKLDVDELLEIPAELNRLLKQLANVDVGVVSGRHFDESRERRVDLQ
jgi:hypothetical protein